ncbi:MAG TPA: excinuclease ABC subunit UvrC [Candidatus Wujingus californicus]|uniref:excinuclease ABC subunit UvrC n=1 Tax=Candidatus Wujingus californicus TaxID=3367618 RepID=UPI001D6CA407|nr:excinuclease ABC subunit UvrC [Planctomycetota bacterium]MDO8130726.1 excinuclease ABC subunit UvrC [Candidatus Brocadiales bacterium]
MKLEDKLKNLPVSTGVYIMKDAKHKVIYIGKAKNIKNRVRHYFRKNKANRLYTEYLVRHVADIDFVLTETEKESLILENNLIKQFKPRFNINLRDDKTFVSIKIDIKKKYPYPMVVRQIENDGALYFGPYASARAVRETLRYIHDTIPIRKCPDNVFKNRVKPCLYYQIHKCMAPCCGLIDEAVYEELLKQVILILKGKQEDLVEILKKQMYEESNTMRYERAAKIRDRIKAIEETLEKQRIHSVSFVDRDVFGYYAVKNDVYIQIMFIRSGNMEDLASYHLYKNQNNIEEVFRSFLNQFYSQTRFIPSEIIIPVKSEDSKLLEEWLSERKGKRVEVICPVRGDKVRLVEMAQKNAENAYLVSRTQEDFTRTLYSLKEGLKLNNIPECIECFDISNIFGKQAVGSMVVFEKGKPNKSKYKRFKIKTVKQIDDYAMMREVLTRRYKRAVEEGALPDLVIVDGGRGQLSIALRVFEELAVGNVDLIALTKGRAEDEKPSTKIGEQIFKPDVSKPIVLDSSSPELLFLDRVRDEAHRFAVTFHRKLRDREYYKSPLNEIIGIGIIRKKVLMKCFGSIEGIRNATIEQLIEISKLPPKLANDVFTHFHKTNTV